MIFNSNPSKQVQEVILSCKFKKPRHPVLIFNNNQLKTITPYYKHLDLLLHEQLNFGEHLTYIANKLQKCLPKALIPISKSLSHLISVMEKLSPDQQYNKSFYKSLESLHCNASLTITGAIRDT